MKRSYRASDAIDMSVKAVDLKNAADQWCGNGQDEQAHQQANRLGLSPGENCPANGKFCRRRS